MSRLIAATDAGPLIYLSVLGRLPLLRDLFVEVLAPDAVYEEVVLHGHGLPGANETKAAIESGWLRRAVVQNKALVDALPGELDAGEAEAIALARELGLRWILMDDRSGRAKARLMGARLPARLACCCWRRAAALTSTSSAIWTSSANTTFAFPTSYTSNSSLLTDEFARRPELPLPASLRWRCTDAPQQLGCGSPGAYDVYAELMDRFMQGPARIGPITWRGS